MDHALEIAGYLIVLGALAQVAVATLGVVQRRALETTRARATDELFRERAHLLLRAARAESSREELSWQGLRKFTINRKVAETDDICSFYLIPHDGKPLAPFEAGQYLTFQLRIPDQPKPVVRCYSLSDFATNNEYYRVTIKRQGPPRNEPDAPPGLSSNYFHDALEEGDIVDARAPGGQFFLDQTSETPVVLIGGGVGLTPMLSMLNSICASGGRRETWFFYGLRNRAEHAMAEHLNEIRRNFENVRIVVCYSDPTDACVEGSDYDVNGRVSVDLFREMLSSNNYEFYICGPPPMMNALTQDLAEWGVPDEHVHFEAFGPATVRRQPAPDTAAAAVEVVFERTGKTVQWKADAGSLLDLAEASDIVLDSGCRAGNCGTCITAIREGTFKYLNTPGAPPEDGTCLICIAVPDGRLVLDA